ncbi:hypothetical protein [Rubrivirga litoralis]|uniref:Cupin domain-containing protein n=1 Tax=Rubrivirga litoralis TaxID=3075598 RepID=A0ABU3BTN9_9BACT|nr:hypothetical protein [Rubrivirga sp. F394]MDT0632653.1 hypothetical protein [Rubrivirga sp. F394]
MPDVFRLTRIVSTAAGGTRFVTADVPLTDQGVIGRMSDAADAGTAQFRETDDDYDWDYHPAPARQLILLLDGEIEIACTERDADGQPVGSPDVRRFGPGEVLLVEDVDGHGHKTRQLSAGPRRSVFVTLAAGALAAEA